MMKVLSHQKWLDLRVSSRIKTSSSFFIFIWRRKIENLSDLEEKNWRYRLLIYFCAHLFCLLLTYLSTIIYNTHKSYLFFGFFGSSWRTTNRIGLSSERSMITGITSGKGSQDEIINIIEIISSNQNSTCLVSPSKFGYIFSVIAMWLRWMFWGKLVFCSAMSSIRIAI